eukprot:TRINITY_DN22335_c0_g1_i1.p1 TRINITY_DN22335_c0_g1~~TRINITY_DN22335_c0_g1_i1.p1  ORF type:complete len:452 (+),score=69.74 TRINITY_DN22335_c0_g1_i1:175-1530(+)
MTISKGEETHFEICEDSVTGCEPDIELCSTITNLIAFSTSCDVKCIRTPLPPLAECGSPTVEDFCYTDGTHSCGYGLTCQEGGACTHTCSFPFSEVDSCAEAPFIASIVDGPCNTSSPTNIIVNGGFEDPIVVGDANNGITSIPGWSTAVNTFDHVGDTFNGAAGTRQCVDLKGSPGSARLVQDITISEGTHTISFYHSGNPDEDHIKRGRLLIYTNDADQTEVANFAFEKDSRADGDRKPVVTYTFNEVEFTTEPGVTDYTVEFADESATNVWGSVVDEITLFDSNEMCGNFTAEVISAPSSIMDEDYSGQCVLFQERECETLAEDVTIRVDTPGTYQGDDASAATLPQGTQYSSYFLLCEGHHSDPGEFVIPVCFAENILGFVFDVDDTLYAETDEYFNNPSLTWTTDRFVDSDETIDWDTDSGFRFSGSTDPNFGDAGVRIITECLQS